MFEVATTTGSLLTANITSQLSDPGTLTILVLAAGIPLAFYIAKRLIGMLPKGR